ncbi:MAG: 6-pyruvoyl trahydropterin synthase family protein [Alphaproteobacteria bacterium]|jgi:6-pyruvoyltetrahydropterin/6-carboxytetrahydropterin synthase
MSPLSVNIITEFSAGKRLRSFEGNCKFVHGYRHKIEASFTGEEKNGLVIDFYQLKTGIEGWVNKNWDHNLLLNKKDKKLGDFVNTYTGQKVFYFDGDPTSENMAIYLKDKVFPKLFPALLCKRIRVYDNDLVFVEI